MKCYESVGYNYIQQNNPKAFHNHEFCADDELPCKYLLLTFFLHGIVYNKMINFNDLKMFINFFIYIFSVSCN